MLFIDASRDFEAGKNQNPLRETDLQRILTTAATRQSVDKYAPTSPRLPRLPRTTSTSTSHAMWTPLRKKPKSI